MNHCSDEGIKDRHQMRRPGCRRRAVEATPQRMEPNTFTCVLIDSELCLPLEVHSSKKSHRPWTGLWYLLFEVLTTTSPRISRTRGRKIFVCSARTKSDTICQSTPLLSARPLRYQRRFALLPPAPRAGSTPPEGTQEAGAATV